MSAPATPAGRRPRRPRLRRLIALLLALTLHPLRGWRAGLGIGRSAMPATASRAIQNIRCGGWR